MIAIYLSNCSLQSLRKAMLFIRYSYAICLLKQLLNFFTHDVRRGFWTLRLSVDLEHLGFIDESLQVAENGLSDSWIRSGSRMALQRRVLRLGRPPRRWKVPSFSKSIMRKIPEVMIVLIVISWFRILICLLNNIIVKVADHSSKAVAFPL